MDEILYSVLKQSQVINPKNVKDIISISGGCHSKVYKLETDKNITFIVKILDWDKTFLKKFSLFTRFLLSGIFYKIKNKEIQHLISYQREMNFYKFMKNKSLSSIKIPYIYYSHNDFFNNKFYLIMSNLSSNADDSLRQSYSFEETKFILEKISKFHADFWETKETFGLLGVGGYWTEYKRYIDKKNIVKEWSSTIKNFKDYINFDGITDLGKRLENLINICLDMHNNNKIYAPKTLIHGDLKITNVFIENKNLNVIDWQWVGKGLAAIDISYFLCTSLDTDSLKMENIIKLSNIYYENLLKNLNGKKSLNNYPFEIFFEHIMLSIIDFVCYFISCKLGNRCINDIDKYKKIYKDGLHLRSTKHIQNLLILAYECTNQILKY